MFCQRCGQAMPNGAFACPACGFDSALGYAPAPVDFVQAIRICFAKYGQFEGRASRAEFWWFMLFDLLVSIAAAMIDATRDNDLVQFVCTLVLLLPGLAVTVRRLHDVGRSGWWYFISLTGVGIIPLIYWSCRRGDAGANAFGRPDSGLV
jgi:uncharacterized membrane protein YhaH (DUF805 family)